LVRILCGRWEFGNKHITNNIAQDPEPQVLENRGGGGGGGSH